MVVVAAFLSVAFELAAALVGDDDVDVMLEPVGCTETDDHGSSSVGCSSVCAARSRLERPSW